MAISKEVRKARRKQKKVLTSSVLQTRRAEILRKARGVCDECKRTSASEVAMATERALCTTCHSRLQGEYYARFSKKRNSREGKIPSKARRREYFASFHWKWLTQMIAHRARGACEHCGRRRSLHTVHTTWDRFLDESFQDLLAVCARCLPHYSLTTEEAAVSPKRRPRWGPMEKQARVSLAKSAARLKGGSDRTKSVFGQEFQPL